MKPNGRMRRYSGGVRANWFALLPGAVDQTSLRSRPRNLGEFDEDEDDISDPGLDEGGN
jgi:hypothetical protein